MLTFSNINADAFETSSHRGAGRKRPRHRETLSCWQCRNRKIRCDRKSPCQQCQIRGMPSDCFYSPAREQLTRRAQASEETRNDMLTAPRSNSSSAIRTQSPLAAASSVAKSKIEANAAMKSSHQLSLGSRCHVKTKLTGRTHWRAPCNDLAMLKAMLERTDKFADCQEEFKELKSWLRVVNAIPSLISTMVLDDNNLVSLLPDRKICEQRLVEYCQSYGQIYDFIDEASLHDTLAIVYTSPNDIYPVEVSKLILVIAIAMQSDETERLNGQKLARSVEHCYYSCAVFQNPCIGTMQALLLLVIIKMISSSETDKTYAMLGILGLATQNAHSISLHRDPDLFGVNNYSAETRKRLWACFFRLNLEFCIRSGTSLALQLEEVDCPLPSDDIYITPSSSDRSPQNDPAFAITAAKLAKIIAPVHQIICPNSKIIPPCLQKDVRKAFKELQATMPPYLKPGADTANPIQKIQQSLITASMNTVMLIISSQFISSASSNSSQRSYLLDTWDSAIGVLDLFQNQSHHTLQTQQLLHHLLWSDACRAAFTASMVLERLRNIDCDCTMSAKPQHTLSTFHRVLITYLTGLSCFWLENSHKGRIAAKTCLLLGLTQALTSHLLVDYPTHSKNPRVAENLLDVGVAAAAQIIDEMKRVTQNRSDSLALMNPFPVRYSDESTTLQNFWENMGTVLSEGETCTLDAVYTEPVTSVDLNVLAEDVSMPVLSVEPSLGLSDANSLAQWADDTEH